MNELNNNLLPGDFDLGDLSPAQLVMANFAHTRFVLVGCGGTGSYVAASIARYVRVLLDMGQFAEAVFIDPDYVVHDNLFRQNFCPAEVGLAKATTLALRYASAWRLQIPAMVAKFSPDMIRRAADCLTIIVGCVDNAEGRQSINEALRPGYCWEPSSNVVTTWHLDCGNGFDCGTVLLGSAPKAEMLKGAFPASTVCCNLPSPALQNPALLIPKPEETSPKKLSCAELVYQGEQSLSINTVVAGVATDYLYQLAIKKNLRRFATFFDLDTGTMASECLTPKRVAAKIGQPVEFLLGESYESEQPNEQLAA